MNTLKIRIKFRKKGRLKYIGHLDVLNLWNRAVKAAKLPVLYSKGFNPHMLMSFAAPLSLGLTSRAEYVDIDFGSDGSGAFVDPRLLQKINDNFPDGLFASDFYVLTEPYKKVAAIVTKAEYEISCPRTLEKAHAEAFLRLDTISIMKKTKRRNELADIKKDIHALSVDGNMLSATLSCGGFGNLKPELLLDALCDFVNASDTVPDNTKPLDASCFGIERTELFGNAGNGEKPLSKLL